VTATADAPPRAAGIHGHPEADYFGDTWALSCSGAKAPAPAVLARAKFFWRQDHPSARRCGTSDPAPTTSSSATAPTS